MPEQPQQPDGEHPYADIINLFQRETPEPEEPRGGTPVTRITREPTPPPTRRRRLVLLLPVALLALVAGAAAVVVQRPHHPAPTAAPTVVPPSPTPTPSSASTPASPPAIASSGYAAALDAYAAVTTSEAIAAAASSARGAAAGITGGDPLARAETRHLDALARMARLSTDQHLADFPGVATRVRRAARAVTRASAARSDVPDPTLATDAVLAAKGDEAVRSLDARLDALASSAAKAELTAQLRAVAAQARTLRPIATGTAGVLRGSTAHRASVDARALTALESLAVLDGDHLGSWAALATPLRQALSDAGVAAATQDVAAIDATIAGAQHTLQAWAAQQPSETATPDPAPAAITAYADAASALLSRYRAAVDALPRVGASQQPDFAVTTRFYRSLGSLTSVAGAAARLTPPPGFAGVQQAVAGLVASGRSAALAGHLVALDAEDCDQAKRACAYGSMKGWAAYQRAVQRLGDAGAVRAALSRAEATAEARGANTAAAAQSQPKPVV